MGASTRGSARALLVVAMVTFIVHGSALGGDRPDIYSFSGAQRADLFTQMSNYITSTIILDHLNPPGDKHNSSRFFPWHRDYIKKMEDYLISQNKPQFVPLPRWDPSTAIPAEFLVGGGVDPDCPAFVFVGHNCNPLSNSNPGISLPSSLSTNLCSQNNFNSFRCLTEHGYHDGVHVTVGGAMGAFKSPAAPIFWLWHGFVDDIWFDWQCSCGLDEGGAFNSYTAGERSLDLEAGIADAWMKDSDADIANEPNNETGAVLWESKDIWVRNNASASVGATRYLNEHQHQNPEYAVIPANRPYIYAKVRNRGCQTVSGQLHVYWANASTGLTWPTDFTELPTSPVALSSIGAGREHVGEFHWTDIPVPGGLAGSHFCLVARFVASPVSADPINGEANFVNVWQNVKNSNQIAWKNLTIVNNEANNIQAFVRNSSEDGDLLRLTFTVPAEQRNDPYFAHGRLAVDLGELFPLWLQGGGAGNGIAVGPTGLIDILDSDASIDNLPVDPGAEYLINLVFAQGEPPCEDNTTEFGVRVNAFERETLLGGNTYQVVPSEVLGSPLVQVVAPGPQTVCEAGGSVPLRAIASPPPGVAVVFYQWILDGIAIAGADQAGYTATSSGLYSVLVGYGNGCDRLSVGVPVHVGVPPTNDDACGATVIQLGQPTGYDSFCAGVQQGEVSPGPGSGPLDGCNARDGWCSTDVAVQNSVWFEFTAPASGAVLIGTGHHDHVNGQLAVWEAGDCADFSTYALIAANDDSFEHGVWGSDPALVLDGLVAGSSYYVQLDGYDGWKGAGTIVAAVITAACPCEFGGDPDVIDVQDLLQFLSFWFVLDPASDLNGDGVVDVLDLLDLLSCWFPATAGEACP